MHTSKQLLYHTMSVLKSNTTDKVFELVVDLTQATPSNEPDVSTLGSYMPSPDCHVTRCSPASVQPYH